MNRKLSQKCRCSISYLLTAAMALSGIAGPATVQAAVNEDLIWEYKNPMVAATLAEQEPELPGYVALEGQNYKVAWEEPETSKYSEAYQAVQVNGSMDGRNEPVQASVEVIPEDLLYFVDCTADVEKNPADGKDMNITSLVYCHPSNCMRPLS